MCIIAIKNKGVNMPDEKTLKIMIENNPDGAGIMYAYDNKVHIEKGFMTYKAFETAINKINRKYDISTLPLVMHFRIATSGNVDEGTTHPFPVSSKRKILRRLNYTTDLAIAHNGVIPISAPKNTSDTMEYTAKKLTVYKDIQKDFYKHKCYLKHIEKEIKSKMVFLDKDGYITTVGEFITEKDGMIYSNCSYMERTYFYYDNWYYASDLLCPIDGYIIKDNGELVDSYDDFFLMDKYGNVYQYDFNCDVAVPIDATAYTYNCTPYIYDEENAMYFDVEI